MKLDKIALCYMLSAPAARAFAVTSSRRLGVRSSSLSSAPTKSLRRAPFAMVSTATDTSASETTVTADDAQSNPLLDQKGLPRFASIEPRHLTPAVSKALKGKRTFSMKKYRIRS